MSTTDETFEAAAMGLLQPETDDTPEPVQADVVDEVEEEEIEADALDETELDAQADDTDDEDDEADLDDADIEEPDTIPVKVDGQEVRVTLEDLKRSYSGQAYIQQGMKEAADKRKQVDQLYQSLQTEQQRFLQTVQNLQKAGMKSEPQRPDPALMDKDPVLYIKAQAKYDNEVREYQTQQHQIQQAQQRNQQVQQAAMQEHLAQQAEILQQRIPEFADAQKAGEVKARLVRVGQEYGYSEDELAALTDARAVQVLHDAARYRELQAGKAEAKKKATAPRNVKPAARRAPAADVQRKKQLQAAKRSGNLEDFVATMFD